MRHFYFAGWHVSESSDGWHVSNVSGAFDSPEQAKGWILDTMRDSER